MRKELWFGLSIMALIVVGTVAALPPVAQITQGHLGLLMLSLVVVAIMLGFPTAFTLMGMGMLFAFASYTMQGGAPGKALQQTLDLMVQRAYSVMTNDVLISIPLFVFMGYLVERANLIEKLFKTLHLALVRIPGSLAVATLVTCAVFATATGIVGAVVTLMGLLALPAMLRAGYSIKLSAGVITAGGCLGILIPPSVMLIVYGATAGVSVVKLYAGAFFPGIMLALLYIAYVIIVAKIKPELAPPLPESERKVNLPAFAQNIVSSGRNKVIPGLLAALNGKVRADAPGSQLLRQLLTALAPAIVFCIIMGLSWHAITKPNEVADFSGLESMGAGQQSAAPIRGSQGLQEPPADGLKEPSVENNAGTLKEPPAEGVKEPPAEGLKEPPSEGLKEPPSDGTKEPAGALKELPTEAIKKPPAAVQSPTSATPQADGGYVRLSTPTGFWVVLGAGVLGLAAFYVLLTFVRLEIFKMLLGSFFPLAIMILAVLGTIVFGLATPTEAAAIGSLGGFILAAVYLAIAKPKEESRRIFRTWLPLWMLFGVSVIWFLLLKFEVLSAGPPLWVGWLSMAAIALWCVVATFQVKLGPIVSESVFLTAKTSAMVCWLFVGSSIFSAAFALLGGQEIIEHWVLSLGLTPIQFMVLAQIIIFLLGWPLEWTEIIVIFMPIFIPLLAKFNIDPLFFGLLVALNLQTAFLSPPVAMAAFYLKGVSPPHVTLNQIFAGMMPFMAIQVLALVLLYVFPGIGLWLPNYLYK